MDVRTTFVTDAQPPVLVFPGQGPLHRPAGLTQPALVVDPLLGQDRLDPDLPQPLAMRLGVVGLVPLQGIGLLPRVADLARHRWDLVEQRRELGHVVDVGRRHRTGQRDAAGVGDHMVLAAGLGAVDRAGAGLLAAIGGPHEAAVDQGPRPVDLVGAPQPVEQDLVDLVPGAVGLPVPQPPPAGHPAPAVHLTRQVFPVPVSHFSRGWISMWYRDLLASRDYPGRRSATRTPRHKEAARAAYTHLPLAPSPVPLRLHGADLRYLPPY